MKANRYFYRIEVYCTTERINEIAKLLKKDMPKNKDCGIEVW